jgi:Tfp pilus assembly protein PilO
MSEWQRLDTAIKTKTDEIGLLNTILGMEQEVNARFDQYRALLAQQSTDEVVRNELMQDINTISARSELKAPVIREGSTESYRFYKRYFVDLDIEGAIPNVGRFLANLQESNKLFRVESLTITKKAGSALNGRMEVSKILVAAARKDGSQETQPVTEMPQQQEDAEHNLVANGDFELWSAGWGADKYPDSWSGYRVTTARATDQAVSGFAAARIEGQVKGSGVVQEVLVRAATRYRITCHAALRSGSVLLRVRDTETGQFYREADVPVKGEAMRMYTQTFTSLGEPGGPERTVVLQLHFSEPGSTIVIDDVRMVRVEGSAEERKEE